jgi:hypothetical protein
MMKMGMLAAGLTVFATGAAAQHEEHHPEEQATQSQATQPKTQNPAQPGTMGPGMMGGGMMAMMMGQNLQMSDSMNKIMQNVAAMQNEKDPAKMKSMMAEQSTMMEQMRTQMMRQGGMMQDMSAMMKNCPMMRAAGQTTAPSNSPSK